MQVTFHFRLILRDLIIWLEKRKIHEAHYWNLSSFMLHPTLVQIFFSAPIMMMVTHYQYSLNVHFDAKIKCLRIQNFSVNSLAAIAVIET